MDGYLTVHLFITENTMW